MSSFGRGSLAQKNAEEGTGLGLPIVKGLVELHGGTFTLKSEVRVGTEVIIVQELGGEQTDAAAAAALLARSFPSALDGLNARTYGPPGLEADVEYCARENLLAIVPRLRRMVGPAAEIVA